MLLRSFASQSVSIFLVFDLLLTASFIDLTLFFRKFFGFLALLLLKELASHGLLFFLLFTDNS